MSVMECIIGKVPKALESELTEVYERELRAAGNNEAAAELALRDYLVDRVNDMKRVEAMNAVKTQKLLDRVQETYERNVIEFEAYSPAAKLVATALRRAPTYDRAYNEVLNLISHEAGFSVQQSLKQLELMAEQVAERGLMIKHDTDAMKALAMGLVDGVENVPRALAPLVRQTRQVMDNLLKEYKAEGGMMGEIENYFPIKHDLQKVASVSKEEWVADYTAMNDLSQIRDFRTGQAVTAERWQEIAEQVYDDIVSDGATSVQRQLQRSRQARDAVPRDVFSRRFQSRLSTPKSGEALLQYNAKYGVGDEGLFDLLISNVRDMAYDVGVMRAMGPMPRSVNNMVGLTAAGAGIRQGQINRMDGMFRTLIGEWKGDNTDTALARGVLGAQHLLSSSLLGGASVAAMGDHVFLGNARRMAGLIGADKGMGAYFKGLVGNPDDAVRAIHIVEALSHTNIARFSGGLEGLAGGQLVTALNTVKNVNHRISGLHNVTLATGDAMSLSTAAEFGKLRQAGTAFEDLNPATQRLLANHQISADDWARLTVDERLLVTPGGQADEALRRKLGSLELQMRAWATNSPELQTRYLSSGNLSGERTRGDTTHLFMSSVMQFKSFPLQVWRNHFAPSVVRAINGDIAPFGTLLAQSLFYGTIIVQAKEVIKGKPMHETDDPELYVKAMWQSGFAGLLGDTIFKDPDKYGRNLLAELLGPVPGVSSDLLLRGLGIGKSAFIADEDADWSGLMRAASKTIPLSSLWYARVAFERIVIDTLDATIDDGFYERRARKEAEMYKDRGNLGWWRQGETPAF